MASSRGLHREKGWRPHDYRYHLLGLDEDIESARKSVEHQFTNGQKLNKKIFEVALTAATEAEAKQLVNCILRHCSTALYIDNEHCGQLRFTALGQKQAWPNKHFDELHWLCTSPASVVPWEDLSGWAEIVHIHHFSQAPLPAIPQARNYQWQNQQELAAFWASLYLAREINGVPGLNWDSYGSWSPDSTIGQTSAGWGSTLTAAVAALLAGTPIEMRGCALSSLLVIEANEAFTWGDYCSVMEQVGKALRHEITPTGWITADYSGYGLKLLVFSPS